MYNYHNLNDVEFESLCQDIMQNKLDMSLRIYAKGKDKGIDLSDFSSPPKVIIQVKHYINSTFSNIRTTMKKEIEKVQKLNPNQYFICIGKELTAANIAELYSMFEQYMDSTENIITLNEIDSLLQEKEYDWIVRKHYKLWLYASNILSEVYNQNVFVDCEVLMSDIDLESKFFVTTKAYEECLLKLDKERAIILLGDPGVGKTITSKMLVLFWASKGYKVRYTTNGDVSDIKNAISSERQTKEIILLNDCLGQHYFAIKETQENELVSLLKFVKLYPNKKIILNSRIAIFNQAKSRSSELAEYIANDNIRISIIDMDCISFLEKAKIFYNHLKYKSVPKEYYAELISNKQYVKIVKHNNYTPRIIEYTTLPSRYESILPSKYVSFIMQSLNHPNDIWKNEFEHRLQPIDRILMNTLYSLTDTTVKMKVLEECFNHRIKYTDTDTSLNQFKSTVSRLNGAMIRIVDHEGVRCVEVINPSVNDYLRQYLDSNPLEKESITDSILYYRQLQRCYSKEVLDAILNNYFADRRILDLRFDSINKQNHFIASQICSRQVLDVNYRTFLINYLLKGTSTFEFRAVPQHHTIKAVENYLLSKDEIFLQLLKEPLYSFYNVEKFIIEENNIADIIQWFDFNELDIVTSRIYDLLDNSNADEEAIQTCIEGLAYAVECSIKYYAEDIETSEYCESYDISQLISDHSYNTEYGNETDEDTIVDTLKTYIIDDVRDTIESTMDVLPERIREMIVFESENICVDESDIKSIVEAYMEPDYDDYADRYHSSGNIDADSLMIETIFERE